MLNQFKDKKLAFEYFKTLAEYDISEGIHNVGVFLSCRIGTMMDNMVAQYNLAKAYEDGEGIDKDMNKAIEWYFESKKLGYSNAIKALKCNY